MDETLTTTQAQELLGLGSPAAARVQLRRWGIQAAGRTLDGEKTWPADEVRSKAAARPGRGTRTDLRHPDE